MTIKNSDSSCFSTTDTALAAWLYSQGFELLDMEAESFPSKFIFENSNPSLANLVREFQCGKAEGNILIFYRAYKKLIKMVKTNQSLT